MIGRRDSSEYQKIIAVVKVDSKLNKVRVSPAPGHKYSEEMYIECSKQLRKLPVGTKVRLRVIEKNPKNEYGTKHLYSSYKWDYEIVG